MENIKATRMEYLKLKRRLKVAKRGYKLLKEKRDGLMKKFMEIVRETKSMRHGVEQSLAFSSKQFAIATSTVMEKEVEEFFALPSATFAVTATEENIMSVSVPEFEYKIEGDFKTYSDFSAPLGMEPALKKFWGAFEKMVKLAGIEHAARLLSFEIEKTRRRVNALEYVIIPEIEIKMKYISSKLDEQERAEKIIRMKIKDMITE